MRGNRIEVVALANILGNIHTFRYTDKQEGERRRGFRES